MKDENIYETTVPGSFELPLAARFLALSRQCDVVVCLGCLIKGETMHFEYISEAVAHGLMDVRSTSSTNNSSGSSSSCSSNSNCSSGSCTSPSSSSISNSSISSSSPSSDGSTRVSRRMSKQKEKLSLTYWRAG